MVVTHVASLFGVKKADQPAALLGLTAFVAAQKKPERFVHDVAGVLGAQSLPAALEAAGFGVRVDEAGNLSGLHWGKRPLPSDVNALRKVLGAFAKQVRSPSVLVFTNAEGRELDVTVKNGKVSSPFYAGIEIGKVFAAAHEAQWKPKKKNLARALELYLWLVELEPLVAGPGSSLEAHWREALEAVPELLAHAGRWQEVPAACAKTRQRDLHFMNAYGVLLDVLQRPADAAKLLALK